MTFLWSLIQGSALRIAMWLAIAGAVGAVLLGARRAGRNAERVDNLKRASRIKDAQLEATTRRPRTRNELIERLRSGEF